MWYGEKARARNHNPKVASSTLASATSDLPETLGEIARMSSVLRSRSPAAMKWTPMDASLLTR
jgi:hypothetical protein